MVKNWFILCSAVFFSVTLSINMARAGSNITSCSSVPGSSPTTCTQGPCLSFPCVMQCGLKSPYESCQQHCPLCPTIDCIASRTCNQTCQRGQCGELTCNAPNCFQDCLPGICNKMICPWNAVKCVQSASVKDLICEARSCNQSCSRGFCNATCSSTVQTCIQQGDFGTNNMTCAPGVETCSQTSTRGVVIMRCNADVCKQNCTGFRCDMICSSSVKECHQSCGTLASCRLSCEADDCKSDCPAKLGSSGCTFLNIPNKNMKNVAVPAINLSVSCFMIIQSFIFMIKYL